MLCSLFLFDVFIICDKFRFVNMFLEIFLFILLLLVNCCIVYNYSNNFICQYSLYITGFLRPGFFTLQEYRIYQLMLTKRMPQRSPAFVLNPLGYPFLFLSPHPRNNTANVTEIPATIRKRSEYTPNAADTFSQESPAILPA